MGLRYDDDDDDDNYLIYGMEKGPIEIGGELLRAYLVHYGAAGATEIVFLPVGFYGSFL